MRCIFYTNYGEYILIMANKKKQTEERKLIAQNRKARHDYEVLETFEAGIALEGTEVKTCRANGVSLVDAYAVVRLGELIMVGSHFAPYEFGNRFNHQPRRDRKLLMHKREIIRLKKSIEAKGLTLIPLSLYFKHGRVKVELALCRGKNVHDKRDALKKKSDEMEMKRAVSR